MQCVHILKVYVFVCVLNLPCPALQWPIERPIEGAKQQIQNRACISKKRNNIDQAQGFRVDYKGNRNCGQLKLSDLSKVCGQNEYTLRQRLGL